VHRRRPRTIAWAGTLILLITACQSTPPSPARPTDAAQPSASMSFGSDGHAVIDPGQPYGGAEILEAMHVSRRPGGVPDVIETAAVADAIAEALWTFDGQPWDASAVGGSCGPVTCSVEVVGTRADAEGQDLWVFDVGIETGEVTLASRDLAAIPSALVDDLDALTQSLGPDDALAGLPLTTVRWMPPPDDGTFQLAYRAGDEEGSCEADVVLDAVARTIVSSTSVNC